MTPSSERINANTRAAVRLRPSRGSGRGTLPDLTVDVALLWPSKEVARMVAHKGLNFGVYVRAFSTNVHQRQPGGEGGPVNQSVALPPPRGIMRPIIQLNSNKRSHAGGIAHNEVDVFRHDPIHVALPLSHALGHAEQVNHPNFDEN